MWVQIACFLHLRVQTNDYVYSWVKYKAMCTCECFNCPIIMSGHGYMLGNCHSMMLIKFAELVVNDWTINFCLKVHLGPWAGLCNIVFLQRITSLVHGIVWSLEPCQTKTLATSFFGHFRFWEWRTFNYNTETLVV